MEEEDVTVSLGELLRSLMGENNGLNEKIANKLYKNASCLLHSKAEGLWSFLPLQKLSILALF